MAFPTLLTFYAHENDATALATGLSLAKQCNAHLDALHVLRDISKETQALILGISSMHLAALAEEEDESQMAEAGMLFREFNELAEAASVPTIAGSMDAGDIPQGPTARWMISEADPQEELITQSHVHDLSILAWHKEHHEIDLEAVLAANARPVMMVPEGYRPSPIKRAGILWNHSAGATHAIALSLPFLKTMDAVTIISAESNASKDTPPRGFNLRTYLAAHGINAELDTFDASGNPAEALYSQARRFNCDVIVMGAFSKKTLRDKLLGGVTRSMLEISEVPLLMAY